MDIDNTDLREINLKNLNPSGFINEGRLQQSLQHLEELKRVVEELLNIRDRQNNIPSMLRGKISSYEQSIKRFILQIEEQVKGSDEQAIVRKKTQYLDSIDQYYQQVFNIDNPNNQNRLLELLSVLKAFDKPNDGDSGKLSELEQEISEITHSVKLSLEKTEQNRNDSETILNELRKKASDRTVSDYAVVFQDEATKHGDSAQKWLIAGIVLSVLFLIGFILMNAYQLFPTEILKAESNELLRYDLSNLITKLILIAVVIFLISFSFKQYNISRHQQTLNLHRQNALNSYKLFTESIIGEDSNSRNALMVQVAKAIYEHTQSTGYLNERGQTMNSGIVELTKIIGENKTV